MGMEWWDGLCCWGRGKKWGKAGGGWGSGAVHLLLNEFQPSLHRHHGFAPLLCEENGPDELVDLGGGGEGGEFLGLSVGELVGELYAGEKRWFGKGIRAVD